MCFVIKNADSLDKTHLRIRESFNSIYRKPWIDRNRFSRSVRRIDFSELLGEQDSMLKVANVRK